MSIGFVVGFVVGFAVGFVVGFVVACLQDVNRICCMIGSRISCRMSVGCQLDLLYGL